MNNIRNYRSMFFLSLFLFLSLGVNAQKPTADMGRRLTYLCSRNDAVRINCAAALERKYPSYLEIAKAIDNFASNPEDAKTALLSLYWRNGADIAYSVLRNVFTWEQLDIADAIYIADGGKLPMSRTEAERKKASANAAKKGFTEDMANRLSYACYDTRLGIYQFVSQKLVQLGVDYTVTGRIMDRFYKNLDYVESISCSFFELYGDNAYYVLREFYTVEQIEVVNRLYKEKRAKILELEEWERKRTEEKRMENVKAKEAELMSQEPLQLKTIDIKEAGNIDKQLTGIFFNMMNEEAPANCAVCVSDTIKVERNGSTTHSMTIGYLREPDAEEGKKDLTDKIRHLFESQNMKPYKIQDNLLRHEFPVSYIHVFNATYDKNTKDVEMKVHLTKDLSTFDLKEGDWNVFFECQTLLKSAMVRESVFGKKRLLVTLYYVNGELNDVTFVVCDKKKK